MAVLTIPNVTAWSPHVNQGVVGGIPTRATVHAVTGLDEGASGSRAVNDAAYAAAMAAASDGDSVVFPAGVYRVTTLNHAKSGVTVRGSGMFDTFIWPNGNRGFILGVGASFPSPFSVVADLVSGGTKDSSSFVIGTPTWPIDGSTQNFTVGRMIQFVIPNESSTPVVSTGGNLTDRTRYARVTSWNSGTKTLGFYPPLDHDIINTVGFQVRETQVGTQSRSGIEDLTIDGTDSAGAMKVGVFADLTDQLFMRKVRVLSYADYGFQSESSVSLELRQCWIGGTPGGGSNKAGFLINSATHALVEHNVSVDASPNFEVNAGSVGCIFGYNYCSGIFNANHGSHNSYNLYEGNSWHYFQSDGYFGGCSQQTLFRNWCRSGIIASLKRFCRQPNVVGNIDGTPGQTYTRTYYERWGDPYIGNENPVGTWQLSAGSYSIDWDSATNAPRSISAVVTTRTDSSNAVLTLETGGGALLSAHLSAALEPKSAVKGTVVSNLVGFASIVGDVATVNYSSNPFPSQGETIQILPSAVGFPEKDLDVLASAFLRANYSVFILGIPSGQELTGGDELPDSLYLTEKPEEFGALDWPPYDPSNTTTVAATATSGRLPADVFFEDEVWPGDTPPTPAAPAITLQPVTQTVTEGDDVTLSINASGYPAPTYQWYKGGSPISGKTTRFLVLLDVTTGDAGSYTCVATNTESPPATSNAAVLTVNEAPDPEPEPATTAQPRRRATFGGFGF